MTCTPLSHFFVFKALKSPLQIFFQIFDFWILCNLYVITFNYFKRTVKGQFIAKEEFRFWVLDQHLLQSIQVRNQVRDPRTKVDCSLDRSVRWRMWHTVCHIPYVDPRISQFNQKQTIPDCSSCHCCSKSTIIISNCWRWRSRRWQRWN